MSSLLVTANPCWGGGAAVPKQLDIGSESNNMLVGVRAGIAWECEQWIGEQISSKRFVHNFVPVAVWEITIFKMLVRFK
jgi:hypothetical protein